MVAMVSGLGHQYNQPVKFEIRKDVKNDYLCAADYLNFSHVDLISVQHEFRRQRRGLSESPAKTHRCACRHHTAHCAE
jgi:hypothetical protein